MAVVTYNGASATYSECTENYNKALATNRLIDGIADNISSYKRIITGINTDCTNNLVLTSSLMSGVRSSISRVNSLISSFEDSCSAMKESNIEEAKKLDDKITEENRNRALNNLKQNQSSANE